MRRRSCTNCSSNVGRSNSSASDAVLWRARLDDAVEGRAEAVEGRAEAVEGRAVAVEGRVEAVEGRVDAYAVLDCEEGAARMAERTIYRAQSK